VKHATFAGKYLYTTIFTQLLPKRNLI
jgi:hypothetical protein